VTTTFRRALSSAALAAVLGAGAAPITPLAAAADNPAQLPALKTVTDDTGAFSVDIPQEWVATTTPGHYVGIDDQFSYDTLLPTIVASQTGEQFTADGTTVLPSLLVQVYPTVDAATFGEFYGDYGVDCTTDTDFTFAANGLSGRSGTTSGCSWAPEQTRASLWATFDDGSGSVFADYFSTTGADVTWDAAVNSIRRTGAPIETSTDPTVAVFPYTHFGDVPQLGSEPVRGTGCGADGSVGDVVPDGIWAGFVDVPVPGEPLSVDLLCIFTPEAAPGVLAGGSATMLIPDGRADPDPNYLVVNNNERERRVPTAAVLELRDAVFDGELCVEGPFLSDVDHSAYQAWITIDGGVATWVIWGCDWYGAGDAPIPDGPAPATTAPAPSGNTEEALILADCASLESTIWEGDQFVGVEYPADGEPFTDSLRQAVETSRDFFSDEAPQVQSQLAQDAFAQYYAEWDSLLQAGIYTTTNIHAVTESGWHALAPLQNACGWAG